MEREAGGGCLNDLEAVGIGVRAEKNKEGHQFWGGEAVNTDGVLKRTEKTQ